MQSRPPAAPEEERSAVGADLLRAIIEHLPLMVFVKDADELRFELVNRACEKLVGHGREALLGRTDRDFFPAEQAEFFQEKDREALASSQAIEVREEPISTPAGTRWLHTMKMAIRDDAGVARHLVGISEDITARREMAQTLARTEDKLRHAQKMDELGKLAGGIAHDFNNLLMVILTYAELAVADVPETDPTHECLGEILQAATRGAELTRQLLAFTGGQAAAARTIDPNAVISGMERMLRRVVEESIDLVTVLSPGAWPVSANPSALEQVVMNLVVNARDAMPDGGTLTIETANVEIDELFVEGHPGAALGPHVMLAVTDTGTGMDKATLARVFEPFFTTKGPGKGTGLGLWNVYGIVHQLGGDRVGLQRAGKRHDVQGVSAPCSG